MNDSILDGLLNPTIVAFFAFHTTDIMFVHPAKAFSGIFVTPLPMVTEDTLLQSANADPTLVTPLGISMEVKLEQP